MTKKMRNFAMGLAGELACRINSKMVRYEIDGKHYVMSPYMILQTEVPIFDLPLEHDEHTEKAIVRFMNEVNDWSNQYIIHDIPSLQEIKEGIRSIAGRTLQTVAYSAGEQDFSCNARFLRDIVDVLHCKVCYVNDKNRRTSPLFFYGNDDLGSGNVCMLLPVTTAFEYPEGYFMGK